MAALLLVVFLVFGRSAGHFLDSAALFVAIAVAVAVAAVAAAVAFTMFLSVRRRRAAAGGCVSCQLRCQHAMTEQPRRLLLVSTVDRGAADGSRGANSPAGSAGPRWPDRPAIRSGVAVRPVAARPVAARPPAASRATGRERTGSAVLPAFFRGLGQVRRLATLGGTFGWVQVTVRTYEPRDAADVAEVFYRSVREVARSDYTDEQLKAWVPGPLNVEREHLRSSDGRLVLVAADERDRVVAFTDLEPDGHIDRLFCAPEAVGRGIASQLYDALEAAALEQGIGRLFTEASELARRFFERKGFVVLERQDKILRGVPIHNYRMAKALG
jgi:putative acetyltransferase